MACFSRSRCIKEGCLLKIRWLPSEGHVVNVENNKVTDNDDRWLVGKYYIRRFLLFKK